MSTLEERTCEYKRRHKQPVKARQSDIVRIGDLIPAIVAELTQRITKEK